MTTLKSSQQLPLFDENPQTRKKLTFNQGSNFFRQRLILSLLSSRPIKIENIRSVSDDLVVGLKPYEVSFVHLLAEISNGSKIKISETGTEVTCIPGLLTGGPITFKAHTSRSLSYYLEPILFLAPFCKKPLELTISGRLQNDLSGYNSVYKLKYAALPIMELFGLEPQLQVTSRKYDDSEVKFTCTVKKQLLTLRSQLNEDCGKVKKIRGLAYGFRVSPQILNRMVTSAKGLFVPFLSDVFITTDQIKGSKSKTPGYGLVLYATTTKEITYAVDSFYGRDSDNSSMSSIQSGGDDRKAEKRKFKLFGEDEEDDEEEVDKKKRFQSDVDKVVINVPRLESKPGSIQDPEELGAHTAKLLLKEMSTQSCVDSVFQWLVLGFMALGPKNVSSVIMGPLTPFTIQYLRDLKTFFGITFKVTEHKLAEAEEDEDEDEDEQESNRSSGLHRLSCLGTGYINLNKTMI